MLKRLVLLSLLLSLLWLPSTGIAAEITEEQAQQIDSYLMKLEQNNNTLEQSWNQSSKDLLAVNVKLGKVESSLAKADTTLATVDQRLMKLESGLSQAITSSAKTESLYKALDVIQKARGTSQ
jgi:chromosome segregation ATPase